MNTRNIFDPTTGFYKSRYSLTDRKKSLAKLAKRYRNRHKKFSKSRSRSFGMSPPWDVIPQNRSFLNSLKFQLDKDYHKIQTAIDESKAKLKTRQLDRVRQLREAAAGPFFDQEQEQKQKPLRKATSAENPPLVKYDYDLAKYLSSNTTTSKDPKVFNAKFKERSNVNARQLARVKQLKESGFVHYEPHNKNKWKI